MDSVASGFLKNKNDLLAKAKQLISNNYLELNQAIHIHSGAKLTGKPLEDKLLEFEEKHQLLQIEFKKISKKPSSVILKKMAPGPVKKTELAPMNHVSVPKKEEKESLREVMQQKKNEMLKMEQDRQRKLQEEQLKAQEPQQIQEQE